MFRCVSSDYYDEIADQLDEAITVMENNGWVQGQSAVDANGQPVLYNSDRAVAFCFTGAFFRANPTVGHAIHFNINPIFNEVFSRRSGRDTVQFNDKLGRTKQEVVIMAKRLAYVARLRSKRIRKQSFLSIWEDQA